MKSGREQLVISSLSAIEHILMHHPERVLRITHRESRSQAASTRVARVLALAREHRIALAIGSRVSSGNARPSESEPLDAVLAPFRFTEWEDFLERLRSQKRALVLALDHLQDPQNLGALCRTAEAMGVTALLLPRERSVGITAGVYHASVGAVETLPIVQVTNLSEALRKLKEELCWIVGSTLAPEATTVDKMPDFEKLVLVMGTELEGMSAGVQKQCDWIVKIPLSGRVQSLNVSAAGAILLYALRQRLDKS